MGAWSNTSTATLTIDSNSTDATSTCLRETEGGNYDETYPLDAEPEPERAPITPMEPPRWLLGPSPITRHDRLAARRRHRPIPEVRRRQRPRSLSTRKSR